MVKFLRLDKHLNPLLLLSLEVLDNGLMVDQVLLILREVLGADVLDLLQLLVVLLIDVPVVGVDFLSCCDYIVFQLVYFLILFRCKVVSLSVDVCLQVGFCFVYLKLKRLELLHLGFLNIVDFC